MYLPTKPAVSQSAASSGERTGSLQRKEEGGYPDTSFQFYSNGKEPIVGLSPAIPSVKVGVVIGPKYAVVAGSIVDDGSGEPVNGTVHLWRRNAPDKPISTGGLLISGCLCRLTRTSASRWKCRTTKRGSQGERCT